MRFEERMGLSTHVETSDRGHQNAIVTDQQRAIEEVSNETGRSSPPGTIGEQHEYMSENIESNAIHKIKNHKGYGNQSSIGRKEQAPISNIARNGQNIPTEQASSVAACSHFAVVREKIALTNDSKHIKEFKGVYDRLFASFQKELLEEYKLMKEQYIIDYQNNYQINVNEKQANIDEFLATIDEKK